jgi:hypothetical protein
MGVFLGSPECITPAWRFSRRLLPDHWSAMDSKQNKPAEHLPVATVVLRPEDLCDLATYLIDREASEFSYDEELDVFRFKDGRFAFCEEFADWHLLHERGWLES